MAMNLNSGSKRASPLWRNEGTKGILKGLLVSVGMGCSTVGLTVILPSVWLAGLAAVIVAPFLIALGVTRNVLLALTLVWLNEAFLGGGGNWIVLGPVNGRALLLLCLVVAFLWARLRSGQITAKEPTRNQWVLFYALALPAFLVVYSIIIKGVYWSYALSDVNRFAVILGYFPVCYLLKKLRWFVVGWLLGASGLLAVLFTVMAATQGSVTSVLLEKWVGVYSDMGNWNLITNVIDTGRASFVPLIFGMIGLFLGLVLAVARGEWLAKTAGFCIMLVAAFAFVINFTRGPLAGIFIALLVLLVGLLLAAEWLPAIKIATIIIAFSAGGVLYTVNYLPNSSGKWEIRGMNLEEILDPVRIEQMQLMLQAWREEPVLGTGVGSSVANYSRTDEGEGLAFEDQYPMLLYRTGIVGFVLILAPFILFIFRSLQFIVTSPGLARSPEAVINLAMCGAVISLLVASAFNPYFATSMMIIFMDIFMASDSAIKFPLARKERRLPSRKESPKYA